jgi:hypothetical protein
MWKLNKKIIGNQEQAQLYPLSRAHLITFGVIKNYQNRFIIQLVYLVESIKIGSARAIKMNLALFD